MLFRVLVISGGIQWFPLVTRFILGPRIPIIVLSSLEKQGRCRVLRGVRIFFTVRPWIVPVFPLKTNWFGVLMADWLFGLRVIFVCGPRVGPGSVRTSSSSSYFSSSFSSSFASADAGPFESRNALELLCSRQRDSRHNNGLVWPKLESSNG